MNWLVRHCAALIAAFLFASPAHADWHVAESEHFIIYADDKEKDIRKFTEQLERYHSAMEFLSGRDTPPPSPSNRVTIFVVGDQKDIRRLYGTDSRTLAGFYVPRAGGSRAFVQDIKVSGRETNSSMLILLHEYAHHYLLSSSRYAIPRWLSEGSAEFFASTRFLKDGTISMGRPALHRGAELSFSREVPLEELFDPELYEANRGKKYDSYYGRSWLLYHYLRFSEARRGQLTNYITALGERQPPLEAARSAFGDLAQLDDELGDYVKNRNWSVYSLKPEWLQIGEINITALSEGEAAMMPVRIRSQRGVNRETAAEVLVDARAIAAEYPNDPGVQTALAEAEFDAGNLDEAIAAADRALAADPNRKNAYVQKGYALFRKAEDADDPDAAYVKAMQPFSALNALENDHPVPLIYYYRSFVNRGKIPPDNARHALERAAILAPFDHGLWFQTALMHANEGKIELATLGLKPIAANPHGGGMADRAKALIDALGYATEGQPFDPSAVLFATSIQVDVNDSDSE